MNKDIKCIVLDIDGTLLDPSRSLTAHTADILRRASDRGITVTLASGRNHFFTQIMLKRAGLPTDGIPVISNNGALITDGVTTHMIMPTSKEAIEEVQLPILDKGVYIYSITPATQKFFGQFIIK